MKSGLKQSATGLNRLDSWKSIGQYFGKTSRTAQRWHAEYGLPVQRLGGLKSPVFAYTEELDNWLRNRGRNLPEPIQDQTGPSLVPDAVVMGRRESHRDEAPSYPIDLPHLSLVTPQARDRARELVTLATQMWDSLSHRSMRYLVLLYREAIDLDPWNSAAFAGLSTALVAEGFLGHLRPKMAYISAEAALQRAQQIDSESNSVQRASGWLKLVAVRDWSGAQYNFKSISNSESTDLPVLLGRAILCIAEGSMAESCEQLFSAIERYPLSSTLLEFYCWNLYLAGEYQEALHQIEQSQAAGNTGPLLNTVEALISLQLDENSASIEKIESISKLDRQNGIVRGALGCACANSGEIEKATELLAQVTRRGSDGNIDEPYGAALILAALNEKQRAVEMLEHSYRQGSVWSLGFRIDPALEPLRNDPNYRHFVSKVGYPRSQNRREGIASAG